MGAQPHQSPHQSPRQQIRQTGRLTLTPTMRQSLRLLAWRNYEIARFVRGLAAENPFIAVDYQEPKPRLPSLSLGEEAFASARLAGVSDISLSQYLLDAVDRLFPLGRARGVAMALVAHVDAAGWLDADAPKTAAGYGMAGAEYEGLVRRLQSVPIAGLFARNLEECLRLQLEDRGELDALMRALLPHLSLLLSGGEDALAAASGLTQAELQQGLTRLKRLDPKPGAQFRHDDGDIFRPDILVEAQEDGYAITLNRANLPVVRLADNVGGDEVGADDVEGDADLLKKAEAEVAALNAHLSARNRMLLALTQFVVARQGAFLRAGEVALEPLTMADAARQLACHPSTITRLVQDKLVLTPRGMVELRAFFSIGVAGKNGKAIASHALNAYLLTEIESEDKTKPLTDGSLAEMLDARYGIMLTARAVAKRRTKLHIARASSRKLPRNCTRGAIRTRKE